MCAIANATNSKVDPCAHMIISWNKHEQPTDGQIKASAEQQLKALGYDKHQYVCAIHRDKEHTHVHIVINKVNPITFRTHTPMRDFFIMDRTCRETELKHGWSHDNGAYAVEYVNGEAIIIESKDRVLLRKLSDKAVKIETHSGKLSFERAVKDSISLRDCIKNARSWQQIHDQLRISGHDIIPSNKHDGFVIHSMKTDDHAKLSLIDSYDIKELQARLGVYKADTRQTDQEVQSVLFDLTKTKAWFSETELNAYLISFVEESRRDDLKKAIIVNDECIHLNSDRKQLTSGREIEVPRYTTKAVLAEERETLEIAERLSKRKSDVSERAIQRAISSRDMRDDQLDAFQKTIKNGGISVTVCESEIGGIAVIRGRAGVGKSYTTSAIREAYEGSGYTVIGMGPLNEVINACRDDGFKQVQTIDAAIQAFENKTLKWNRNTVLVIDEAGMIANDKMLKLLQTAEKSGVAKIILVGDDRQLPAIERGGMFAELAARYDGGEIKQITRQKEDKQRQAAQLFSEGRFEDGMAIFNSENRIKWSNTEDDVRENLINDYIADYKSDAKLSRFVISFRNSDVDYFNRQIHDKLKEISYLSGFSQPKTIKTAHGEFEFCLNEDVQFTKTDKNRGITNGLRGKVSAWTNTGLEVTTEKGIKVIINLSEFDNIRHGHAGTTYKAQGKSIDNVFVHQSKDSKDAASYVNLTRQKMEAYLYVSKEGATDWRDIGRQMSVNMLKSTASSIGISDIRHEAKPIIEAIDKEAALRINAIKETKHDDIKPDQSPPKKNVLHETFKAELTINKEAWLVRLSEARTLRDNEVSMLRDDRAELRKTTRLNKVEFDKQTSVLVHHLKSQHSEAISSIVKKEPKVQTYKEWLDQQSSDEAQYELKKLEAVPDPMLKEHLVDLLTVMNNSRDYKVSKVDFDRVTYSKSDNEKIIIKTDQNGSGMSWYSPGKKIGGGFLSLLKETNQSDKHQQYLKGIPDPMSNAQTQALYEHRTISQKVARKLWQSGRPVNSKDHGEAAKLCGSRVSDLKEVARPYGNILMLANRDKNNNIVGFEIFSDKLTIAKGSNERAAHLVKNTIKNDKVTRENAEKNTPELSDDIAALKGLDVSQETIDYDTLDRSCRAYEHLKLFETTLSVREHRILRAFEPLKESYEDQLKEEARQQAEAQRIADREDRLQARASVRYSTDEAPTTSRGYGR